MVLDFGRATPAHLAWPGPAAAPPSPLAAAGISVGCQWAPAQARPNAKPEAHWHARPRPGSCSISLSSMESRVPQAGGDSDVKNRHGVEAQCLVEVEESHSQPIPPTCDSTMRGECMCTTASRGAASCGIRAMLCKQKTSQSHALFRAAGRDRLPSSARPSRASFSRLKPRRPTHRRCRTIPV